MPKRKQSKPSSEGTAEQLATTSAPVRSFWSGTITFGLVSIPVDLFSAVRPRQTAMKLIDKSGHALGRQYHCSKEGKKLDNDELVRGYETDYGKMIEITDEEFESVAPEMSGDIELRNFVPLEQIPPMYFQKPVLPAPAGQSAKAYHLLAATMERTGRIGIGSFVMRGHEYLVAIVSDNGVLRADTLRYADEIRTPRVDWLAQTAEGRSEEGRAGSSRKSMSSRATKWTCPNWRTRKQRRYRSCVKAKQKDKDNVIHETGLEEEDAGPASGGAKIIDLMEVLRKSLSKNAVVTNAQGADVHLARGQARATGKGERREEGPARRKTKPRAKAPRKRARRA